MSSEGFISAAIAVAGARQPREEERSKEWTGPVGELVEAPAAKRIGGEELAVNFVGGTPEKSESVDPWWRLLVDILEPLRLGLRGVESSWDVWGPASVDC